MEGKLYLEIFIRWAIATSILYIMQCILNYFSRKTVKKEDFKENKKSKKQKQKQKEKSKKQTKNFLKKKPLSQKSKK